MHLYSVMRVSPVSLVLISPPRRVEQDSPATHSPSPWVTTGHQHLPQKEIETTDETLWLDHDPATPDEAPLTTESEPLVDESISSFTMNTRADEALKFLQQGHSNQDLLPARQSRSGTHDDIANYLRRIRAPHLVYA